MKYMLLIYANETDVPNIPEEYEAAAPAWDALRHEVEAAGLLLSSSGLAPIANATTLRLRDGKRLISDGPFAETHEQLSGCLLLNCKDLDEALRWAEKIPTAQYGSIEIRPLNEWSQES
jgi:hypothetical protein